MVLGELVIIIIIIISYNRNTVHVDLKTKMFPLEPPQNHSENTCATYRESMKSKKPEKTTISDTAHILCTSESTNVHTQRIALNVPYMVNTEYLQN
jgi:hypothetical protein